MNNARRQARRDVSRLIHGRGHKQAMRWVRRLRTWLGRLDRDIGRKIAGNEELEAAFAVARERVANILTQKADITNKLYALHAPEVECIAKRKARTRYEFGTKTSIAVTNARTAGGQFIVGMQALPGTPYDGHTLSGQLEQVERLTGITVARAYMYRGYKGHKPGGKAKVFIAHTRGIASPTIKRELRRRNAIEPSIGHTKSDGLLERNHLAGATGDTINAILVAAGHNLDAARRMADCHFARPAHGMPSCCEPGNGPSLTAQGQPTGPTYPHPKSKARPSRPTSYGQCCYRGCLDIDPAALWLS